MSEREKAIKLLNEIPDEKMEYVVAYLQGMKDSEDGMPPGMFAHLADILQSMLDSATSARNTSRNNAAKKNSFKVIASERADK